MADLILRRRLSEATVARGIALNGVVYTVATPAVAENISWRWEDDETMVPEFLTIATNGQAVTVPFDLKGRSIRLFKISQTADGVESDRDIKEAVQTVFIPPADPELASLTVPAGEDLTARNFVHLYNDGGTLKARKADATDNTRPAAAFIAADALTGQDVTVYFGGNVLTGLSGLTPGAVLYLSETAGGITATPVSGAGKLSQEVGRALSATSMIFEPQASVELAA